jgi:hypothetical protein
MDETERIYRDEAVRRHLAGPSAHLGKAVEQQYSRQEQAGTMAMDAQTAGPPPSERLTLQNIDDVMHYQPWSHDQQQAGEVVREALTAAAKAMLRSVPESPLRTRALNALIDARMLANAAISFRGRF